MSSNSAPAALLVLPLLVLSGCAAEVGADERRVGETQQALVTEDALSLAFGRFRTEFVELGRDVAFDVGLAPLDAFGTENLGSASVVLSFEKNGDVYTGQFGVQKGPEFELPNTLAYDLFAVRNVSGAGRSARAEAGDQFTKLGTFRTDGSFSSQGVSFRTSGAVDFLLLTRAGVSPASGGVAVGNLSLFERRFFAGAFGWAQPTAAPLATAAVPTTDPLVQQGSRVFFEETFGGNGRTCGTCHRAENNFTIDAAFLASLPASDPLFAAARQVPGLEGLNPNAPLAQIQSKQTLISENLDGTSHAPVFRSVQHTLGMAATTTRPRVPILAGQVLQSPPDERTGWSGDGAPGRGTLHDFAVGAIVQHLTRDVARRPGVDFRLPTQEELDQLEAFQLSLGRSREINARTLAFAEPAAESGKQLFNTQGLCFVCHDNAGARSAGPAIFNNVTLDQGVERRPETVVLGLTPDGGFGRSDAGHGFGNGEFNVQSLIEAADTAPFFHNNSAATLEDAVRHYTTDAFESGPAGFAEGVRPTLNESQVQDVAAFLRVLNAAANVQSVKKQLTFVRDHSGPANARLLTLALADVEDALQVLAQPGRQLAPSAKHALDTLALIVKQTAAQPAAGQAAYAAQGLIWCQVFFDATFRANPNQDFVTE